MLQGNWLRGKEIVKNKANAMKGGKGERGKGGGCAALCFNRGEARGVSPGSPTFHPCCSHFTRTPLGMAPAPLAGVSAFIWTARDRRTHHTPTCPDPTHNSTPFSHAPI
eukprot:259904-Chlamydomonas_euryale.AAC.1